MNRRWIAVVLGVVLTAGILSAQSYQNFSDEYQSIIAKTRWKFGPFRIFPTIALRDVGYDDNLYFGSDDAAPKRDFTATLSPEIKAYWPMRQKLILYVRDNPEYAFFGRETRQRAFTNGWGAGFRYLLLNRFVLSGAYGNDVHRRRLSSEFQIPANDRTESLTAGLSFETARKTSIGITGAFRKISYEEIFFTPETVPVSQLLDREEREIGVETYYQLFTDGFLFLRGDYMMYRFQDKAALWRDSAAATLRAGLRFPLLGRIRGVLNIGYKVFDPKTEGQPDFRGLVGNTGLDLRSGRIGARLSFSRDLVFSTYSEVFYFVEDSIRLGGSLYLTSFLKIDYDYAQGRADYSSRSFAAGEESAGIADGRRDRRRLHSLGLVFRIFRTAGIGISWNSERWISRPLFDRSRNFVGLILTQSF